LSRDACVCTCKIYHAHMYVCVYIHTYVGVPLPFCFAIALSLRAVLTVRSYIALSLQCRCILLRFVAAIWLCHDTVATVAAAFGVQWQRNIGTTEGNKM